MPVMKAVPLGVTKTQPIAQELETLLVKGLHGLPREFCTQWSSEPHHPVRYRMQKQPTASGLFPTTLRMNKLKKIRNKGRLTVVYL